MADALTLFLLVMLLGCGGFSVYTAVKLKKKGCLFSSKILYPGNCNPTECTDEVGFMLYIFPRLLIFGIACLVFGLLICFDTYVGLGLPVWFSNSVMPFIGLPLFIWYMVVQNRASKLFW